MRRILDFLLGVPILKLLSTFLPDRTLRVEIPRKILLIKLAAVGDTILLVPVLKEIKSRLPQAELHWLVSGINAEIAKTVPYADRLWIWNPVSVKTLYGLAKTLRREKFDIVIDAEQWARGTAILTRLIGAPTRIGFDAPGQHRQSAYTHPILKRADQHEIKEFFSLLVPLVGNVENENLELWETEQGKTDVTLNLSAKEKTAKHPWVLIHPGCGFDGLPREWPLAHYSILGHWLIKHYGAKLFLTSGPEETRKTQNLNKLLSRQAVDLGGRLSWQGIVSLVKQVDLVVSGNTGVMHVAAALKKPQVALHGPTSSQLWGPINPKAEIVHSPCPQCPCLVMGYEYHRLTQECMSLIEIEDVKQAVARLFDNNKDIL
jgi:ADP-heptose:LPS heptosyltransferase